MPSFRGLFHWFENHREITLDLIRIYLGVGLFVRGVLFISAANGIEALVDLSEFSFASAAIAHYVTFVHLLGGLMLAVGLLTRLVAFLQLPILIGAVFFVHWQEGILSATQSLEFSALVLFLLCGILVFGSGKWSADYYIFVHAPELEEDRELEPWWRPEEEPRPAPGTAAPATAVEGATGPEEVEEKPAGGRLSEGKRCSCGHDINHPRVVAEPHYSWFAGFFFMLGISAPVKEVFFYCEKCGTVLHRSTDPVIRRKYRWHTS